MDYYHIWCDLHPQNDDLSFAQDVQTYLNHLKTTGLVDGYRLTRRKLGLGPENLGEFHIVIETQGLEQLDRAFQEVAKRAGKTESLHSNVFRRVSRVKFGLYRDFPDPGREMAD